MQDAILARKSALTSGMLLTSNTFRKLVFDASVRTSLSWLISKLLFVKNVKSNSETVGVGTLIAMPSSFPCSSGKTSATAAAAPVLVGIIDRAADRALYKSE